MTFNLAASLQRIRPEKWRGQLAARPRQALLAAAHATPDQARRLLLDTNVYIHLAAGSLPVEALALVEHAVAYHSSVCAGELAAGIANADPSHPSWRPMRDHYQAQIAGFPKTRLFTPDAAIWAEASLIAGTLARCQNWQRHQRKEALNDALIYITAAKAGIPVLTADREDFDLIQQVAPFGRFIYF